MATYLTSTPGPGTVSVETFGGVSNATYVASEAAANLTAFQTAIDTGAKTVEVPSGHYHIAGPLVATGGTNIEGKGSGSTYIYVHNQDAGTGSSFDNTPTWTPTIDYQNALFNFVASSYTSLPALSSDSFKGNSQLSFASAHGLTEGDVVIINDDNYMMGIQVTSGTFQVGEAITSTQIPGTTATIVGSMNENGEASDAITTITGADGNTYMYLIYSVTSTGDANYPAGFKPDKNDTVPTTDTVTGGTSGATGTVWLAGGSYCMYRPYWQDGEMLQVSHATSDTAVEVYSGTLRKYDKDIITLYKISGPVTGGIRGMTIIGPRATGVKPISAITLSGTDPVVVTSNSHGLSNGDEVKFRNVGGTTELNGNSYTLANVTTNTFELSGTNSSLFTAYTSGGTAQRFAGKPFAIAIVGGVKFSIDDVVLEDFYDAGVEITCSFGTQVNKCNINQQYSISDQHGQDYGINISNCQDTLIKHSHINATRHAVSEGGNGIKTGRPNPKCVGTMVQNSVLAVTGDILAYGPKGNTTNWSISNCKVRGGMALAGSHGQVLNNEFYPVTGPDGSSNTFYSAEWATPDFLIADNAIFDSASNATVANGVCRLSPNEQKGNVRSGGPTIFRNNKVTLQGGSNPASPSNTTGDVASIFKIADECSVGFTNSWVLEIVDNEFTCGESMSILNVTGGQSYGEIKKLKFNDNTINGGQINLPSGNGKVGKLEFKNNTIDGKVDKSWKTTDTGYVDHMQVILSANKHAIIEGNTIENSYYGGMQVTFQTSVEKPFIVKGNIVSDYNAGDYYATTDSRNSALLVGANQIKSNGGGVITAGTPAQIVPSDPPTQSDRPATGYGFIQLSSFDNAANNGTFPIVGYSGDTIQYTNANAVSEDNTHAISGATQANPVVITATAHPYSNGQTIYIDGVVGMTELNDTRYKIKNSTTNTFELTDEADVNIDGTGFTAYSSGGTINKVADIILQTRVIVEDNRVISYDRTNDDAYAAFYFNDCAVEEKDNRVAFTDTPSGGNWSSFFATSTVNYVGRRRHLFESQSAMDEISIIPNKLSIDTEPGTLTIIDDEESATISQYMNTDVFSGEMAGTVFQFIMSSATITIDGATSGPLTTAQTQTTVTFGTAFTSGAPRVWPRITSGWYQESNAIHVKIISTSTTSFEVQAMKADDSNWTTDTTVQIEYLAIDIG